MCHAYFQRCFEARDDPDASDCCQYAVKFWKVEICDMRKRTGQAHLCRLTYGLHPTEGYEEYLFCSPECVSTQDKTVRAQARVSEQKYLVGKKTAIELGLVKGPQTPSGEETSSKKIVWERVKGTPRDDEPEPADEDSDAGEQAWLVGQDPEHVGRDLRADGEDALDEMSEEALRL